MAKSMVAGIVCVLMVLSAGTAVEAADLAIPLDRVVGPGEAAGTQFEVADVASADLNGATCIVRSVRRVEGPVVRGNDLIVMSGGTSTTLTDVEGEPEAVVEGPSITLGPTIVVTLVVGEGGEYTGLINLELDDCSLGDTGAADESRSTEGGILPVSGASLLWFTILGVLLIVGGAAAVAARSRSGGVAGRGSTR
jgi:hypothetical protein